jgi:hypothetical protein
VAADELRHQRLHGQAAGLAEDVAEEQELQGPRI